MVNPSSSPFEGPPMSEAVEAAKTFHSDLLKHYNENTRNRVAKIVSDGIKNKRTVSGISIDIRREFPNISKPHADLISQTETNFALSQGMFEKMQNMGVDGKEWLGCSDSCETCAKNATIGVIPTEQPFPSGHLYPPAHDGCRCCLSPARLDR